MALCIEADFFHHCLAVIRVLAEAVKIPSVASGAGGARVVRGILGGLRRYGPWNAEGCGAQDERLNVAGIGAALLFLEIS